LQIAIELGRKKATPTSEIECLRLNTLIKEILEYARLEKSATELNKKLIHLPVLLKQIIDDANFELGSIKPGVKLHNSLDCNLYLDERLIHRALENIIRNALSYSLPEAEVGIIVHSVESSKEIYIDVADNGPGVPEEQLNKIFNPFYRVDTSREKKTGGYGLGLSIAQQAIKLHNDAIQAMNRQSGGLLVRIILPVI
jgi:two-component system, OmpR family, sensor histidine kinase CpxA